MSADNAKIQAVIEAAFTSAIDKLSKREDGNALSDLYVQADQESGELSIFDEEEKPIGKVVIFDWVNNAEEENVFNKRVASTVKTALTALASKKVFENPQLLKPFSVSLTDEDFVVIEELLFLDDDLLRLDDPLLKNLDEDLDNFLRDLLPDME